MSFAGNARDVHFHGAGSTSTALAKSLKEIYPPFSEALRDFYQTQGTIKRLFKEEQMSIDSSYINLCITEQMDSEKEKTYLKEKQKEKETIHDARLQTYEALYNVKYTKLIEPTILFREANKGENSSSKPVKRILIRGRAGIGKSTLCRYLIHQWAVKQLWQEEPLKSRFELVIWVPLRELSTYVTKIDEYITPFMPIAKFLCHYSSDTFNLGRFITKKSLTAEDLSEYLCKQEEHILYILDGYDEISALKKEHPVWNLIGTLKSAPQWIITSRPCNGLPKDEEISQLEIMGFRDENIPAYICSYFKEEKKEGKEEEKMVVKKGGQLIGHLNQNKAIFGIAHIPINLELLCYVWEKEYTGQVINAQNMTMTLLYKKLSDRLLTIYLNDKERGYPRYLQSQEEHISGNPLPKKFIPVINTIGAVALMGLITQELIISSSLIQNMCEQSDQNMRAIMEVGLLKGTGPYGLEDNDYYFLHLTFQEYYAALYIASVFVDENPWYLSDCSMNSNSSEKNHNYQSVQTFIQRYKYDERYEIVWWFVSGLLAERGEVHTKRFFDLLDKSPQDILGFRRTVLLIRLLGECFTKKNEVKLIDYHKRIEKVNNYTLNIALHSDSEILENVTKQLARSISLSPRFVEESKIFSCLESFLISNKRAIIKFLALLNIHGAVFLLIPLLQDEESSMRMAAAEALGKQCNLNMVAQNALISLLQDKEVSVRGAAAAALGNQNNLSIESQIALILLLQDNDDYLHMTAVKALSKQNNLSIKTQTALISLLQDKEVSVRGAAAAATALSKQSNLSMETKAALIPLLQDKEVWVREAAATALSKQGNLSMEAQIALIPLLQDEEVSVREVAAEALSKQSNLYMETQIDLIPLLQQDKGISVRRAVALMLSKQSNLSKGARNALIPLLKDHDAHVRRAALNVSSNTNTQLPLLQEAVTRAAEYTSKQDNLPKNENEEVSVRETVAETLGKQGNLSVEAQTTLIQLLKDSDAYVRRAAAATAAASNQCNLLTEVQMALISLLKNEEVSVRETAAEALSKQSNLSVVAKKALIQMLQNKEASIRGFAAESLSNQGNSNLIVQTALIPLLQDKEAYVRRAVATALSKQDNLSIVAQIALISLLRDKWSYVRRAAAEALSKQDNLYPEAQITLIPLLKNEEASVRRMSVEVLSKQDNLYPETQTALIPLLKNEKASVRRISAEVLSKQSILCIKAQIDLIPLLHDNDAYVCRITTEILKKQNVAALLLEYYQTDKVIEPKQYKSIATVIVNLCALKGEPVYCESQSRLKSSGGEIESNCVENERCAICSIVFENIHRKFDLMNIYEFNQHQSQSSDLSQSNCFFKGSSERSTSMERLSITYLTELGDSDSSEIEKKESSEKSSFSSAYSSNTSTFFNSSASKSEEKDPEIKQPSDSRCTLS